jgi:hypothetical protein
MNWVDPLIDDYYRFLRDKTIISETSSDWLEISTPFTDVFNDTIEIYAKRKNGSIILSDDGQTVRNLELSGMEISRSQGRKNIFEKILLNYGVRFENAELITEATDKNFPQKKHNFLSAIIEANDLFVLAKHNITSLFREDVKNYLEENDIIYTPFFISRGSTGLEFSFDFQVAYRNTEILIKAFNSVNKLNLPHFLFTWDDVRQVREKQTDKEVIGLAIINDMEKDIKHEYLDALQSRQAKTILWTQRNQPESVKKLKAA